MKKDIFHGELIFDTQEKPFVYIPFRAKVEDILNVMINVWNLDYPKIMLLIVSDTTSRISWPDLSQKKRFIQGLVKGSNTTSMWIFTTGLNIGIFKAIGNAIQADYNKRHSQECHRHASRKIFVPQTPLIGICSTRLLTYYDRFRDPEPLMLLENKGNSLEDQKFDLHPYHTHFLLTQDKFGVKDTGPRFLLKIEDSFRAASKNSESTVLPTSPIPIIAILIGGNINSVSFVLDHLKKGLPVLVIRGSGGLADILSYAYYEARRSFRKMNDSVFLETVLKKGLIDKIISIFPTLKDNKIICSMFCNRVLDCINSSKLPEIKYITIFNMLDLAADIEELPVYLLKALFKSQDASGFNKRIQSKKDLLLTIDWNCPELSITQVFYQDPTFKVRNEIFEQVLLQNGRESFVSLFLQYGFEIHKYLSTTTLLRLFENALNEPFFVEVFWERILGYGKVVALDENFIDRELNWVLQQLVGIPLFIRLRTIFHRTAETVDEDIDKTLTEDISRRKAIYILILWALMTKREKLAVLLWSQSDQPIITALMSSLLLDKFSFYITQEETKDKIVNLSKEFATMAFNVFDLCYNDSPSKAYNSLDTKSHEWSGLSIMDVASQAKNFDFVAHPCCQKWLTNKFMGNIKLREINWGFVTFPSYFKILLCAFLIIPMYWWVRFKEKSDDTDRDDYKADELYAPEERQLISSSSTEETTTSPIAKYHYPPLRLMIYWMWSAPITRFYVSNMFYFLFLMAFSAAVMWPSCGNLYLDITICIWTLLIAVDTSYRIYASHKALHNISLFRPCLEIIYMISFVFFYFLFRISHLNAFQYPYAGKVLACLGLVYFYYRTTVMFVPVSSTLGPLLYRVKRMMSVDFINFMKLALIIIFANGLAMQAVLYPDYPLTLEMVRKLFHKAFIALFMTPTDELTKDPSKCVAFEQKLTDRTMCRINNYVDGTCYTGKNFWSYLFVFQYILLMKLVLITVLMALYTNTSAKIGPQSASIWKFQRYDLIHRAAHSLRFPPPLNVFSIIALVFQLVRKLCRKCCRIQDKKEKKGSNFSGMYKLSSQLAYWKKLASDYYAQSEYRKEEEKYTETELNILSSLTDDLNSTELLIYKTKSQISHLESHIATSHAQLESLKYRLKRRHDIHSVTCIHSLSRESPYPKTRIERFAVPDKYVPWEVMWQHYDPPIFTMTKDEFPSNQRPYVDDDLLILQRSEIQKSELPSFMWNMETVDSAGIYQNRNTWTTDVNGRPIQYKLDQHDVPKNPMGRTGLRGKGALPRWGPNHNVYVVITRWQQEKSESSDPALLETSDNLEFVETYYLKKTNISLPGGFVWLENRYEGIRSIFIQDEQTEPWTSTEDMIKFFQESIVGVAETDKNGQFKSEKVFRGYMDDQLNTDNAWKEVELWHIHYNTLTDLDTKFKMDVKWRLLCDDVFIQLPLGQRFLLQTAIKNLKTKFA